MLKYFTAPIFSIGILITILLFPYRNHLRNQLREKTKITGENGIESLEKINLGGVEQWILIRGEDKANPVMLFLHGEPGQPYIYRARDIGVDLKLEQHFVMVYWDQRGQGKSYSSNIPRETMTIEQFVSDIYELTNFLRKNLKFRKYI